LNHAAESLVRFSMSNHSMGEILETETQGDVSEAKGLSERSVLLRVSPRSRDQGNANGCQYECPDGSTKNRNDDGHKDEDQSTKKQ
jgi:hypothetical protein